MEKKYVGGEYIEMTQSEIDEIKAQNQKELLENASKYNLTYDDVLMILASNINMTLPDNTTKPLTEVINTEIDLPFKVGYKWELRGTTFVSVADPSAIGTYENPIIYTEDVQLIENAFYKKDGKIQVYISGGFVEM